MRRGINKRTSEEEEEKSSAWDVEEFPPQDDSSGVAWVYRVQQPKQLQQPFARSSYRRNDGEPEAGPDVTSAGRRVLASSVMSKEVDSSSSGELPGSSSSSKRVGTSSSTGGESGTGLPSGDAEAPSQFHSAAPPVFFGRKGAPVDMQQQQREGGGAPPEQMQQQLLPQSPRVADRLSQQPLQQHVQHWTVGGDVRSEQVRVPQQLQQQMPGEAIEQEGLPFDPSSPVSSSYFSPASREFDPSVGSRDTEGLLLGSTELGREDERGAAAVARAAGRGKAAAAGAADGGAWTLQHPTAGGPAAAGTAAEMWEHPAPASLAAEGDTSSQERRLAAVSQEQEAQCGVLPLLVEEQLSVASLGAVSVAASDAAAAVDSRELLLPPAPTLRSAASAPPSARMMREGGAAAGGSSLDYPLSEQAAVVAAASEIHARQASAAWTSARLQPEDAGAREEFPSFRETEVSLSRFRSHGSPRGEVLSQALLQKQNPALAAALERKSSAVVEAAAAYLTRDPTIAPSPVPGTVAAATVAELAAGDPRAAGGQLAPLGTDRRREAADSHFRGGASPREWQAPTNLSSSYPSASPFTTIQAGHTAPAADNSLSFLASPVPPPAAFSSSSCAHPCGQFLRAAPCEVAAPAAGPETAAAATPALAPALGAVCPFSTAGPGATVGEGGSVAAPYGGRLSNMYGTAAAAAAAAPPQCEVESRQGFAGPSSSGETPGSAASSSAWAKPFKQTSSKLRNLFMRSSQQPQPPLEEQPQQHPSSQLAASLQQQQQQQELSPVQTPRSEQQQEVAHILQAHQQQMQQQQQALQQQQTEHQQRTQQHQAQQLLASVSAAAEVERQHQPQRDPVGYNRSEEWQRQQQAGGEQETAAAGRGKPRGGGFASTWTSRKRHPSGLQQLREQQQHWQQRQQQQQLWQQREDQQGQPWPGEEQQQEGRCLTDTGKFHLTREEEQQLLLQASTPQHAYGVFQNPPQSSRAAAAAAGRQFPRDDMTAGLGGGRAMPSSRPEQLFAGGSAGAGGCSFSAALQEQQVCGSSGSSSAGSASGELTLAASEGVQASGQFLPPGALQQQQVQQQQHLFRQQQLPQQQQQQQPAQVLGQQQQQRGFPVGDRMQLKHPVRSGVDPRRSDIAAAAAFLSAADEGRGKQLEEQRLQLQPRGGPTQHQQQDNDKVKRFFSDQKTSVACAFYAAGGSTDSRDAAAGTGAAAAPASFFGEHGGGGERGRTLRVRGQEGGVATHRQFEQQQQQMSSSRRGRERQLRAATPPRRPGDHLGAAAAAAGRVGGGAGPEAAGGKSLGRGMESSKNTYMGEVSGIQQEQAVETSVEGIRIYYVDSSSDEQESEQADGEADKFPAVAAAAGGRARERGREDDPSVAELQQQLQQLHRRQQQLPDTPAPAANAAAAAVKGTETAAAAGAARSAGSGKAGPQQPLNEAAGGGGGGSRQERREREEERRKERGRRQRSEDRRRGEKARDTCQGAAAGAAAGGRAKGAGGGREAEEGRSEFEAAASSSSERYAHKGGSRDRETRRPAEQQPASVRDPPSPAEKFSRRTLHRLIMKQFKIVPLNPSDIRLAIRYKSLYVEDFKDLLGANRLPTLSGHVHTAPLEKNKWVNRVVWSGRFFVLRHGHWFWFRDENTYRVEGCSSCLGSVSLLLNSFSIDLHARYTTRFSIVVGDWLGLQIDTSIARRDRGQWVLYFLAAGNLGEQIRLCFPNVDWTEVQSRARLVAQQNILL